MNPVQNIPVRIETKRTIEMQGQYIPVQKTIKTNFGLIHEVERQGIKKRIRKLEMSGRTEKYLQKKSWETFRNRFGVPKRVEAHSIHMSNKTTLPFSILINIMDEEWKKLAPEEREKVIVVPLAPLSGPEQFHFYQGISRIFREKLEKFLPKISYLYDRRQDSVFEIASTKQKRPDTLGEVFEKLPKMSKSEKDDILNNIMAWRKAVNDCIFQTGYVPNIGMYSGGIFESDAVGMSENNAIVMNEIFPILPLPCLRKPQHEEHKNCWFDKKVSEEESIISFLWKKYNFFNVWDNDFHIQDGLERV